MSGIRKLHRNLDYPSAQKAYDSLQLAYPHETKRADFEMLKNIAANFFGFQPFAIMPNRYRAVLPDKIIFNYEVNLDIMFLERSMALHACFKHTRLKRATFISSSLSSVIWEVFMNIRVSPYLGAPHILIVHQQKSMISMEMKTFAASLGCKVIPIATEAHWSLVVERFHNPLRRTFLRLCHGFPNTPKNIILDYATVVILDVAEPLVPRFALVLAHLVLALQRGSDKCSDRG